MSEKEIQDKKTGLDVAVIGMVCRFPGAGDVNQFWENLKNGVESISFFSAEELEKNAPAPGLLKKPAFVKASGWLEDIEFFDYTFFGYAPIEAEVMDPQTCILHECALEALENAGYDAYSCPHLIGLYAGASGSFEWQARSALSGKNNILGWFPAEQLNDKDYMATRIANRLNLKGPAIAVDTACSTAMVAIHLGYQGLLSGDCDMALAGGISIRALDKKGYLYEERMLNSPDGHCRAFDAKAKGTNFGNGVGLVVLKRLNDAIADRDTIHAVIKGSAINNDGDRKAGYTAPSIEGQADVISTAYQLAEVEPETIGYVETHGTGTELGDPVEIEGLKSAFDTDKKHFCRIGSVKTNIGHLEAAAGAAGFIKTVMVLKHKLIPPSLFFEQPNPKIDFENSPFVVNTKLTPWEPGPYPRRAGVSSFGIGGTNAHMLLEEAPGTHEPKDQRIIHPKNSRAYQLILLSAKTESALDQMTRNLAEHLKENPHINLADAAYTLQLGRPLYKHRRMLVCPGNDTRETVNLLSTESRKLKTYKSQEDNRPIIFMFPGLDSQYVNMGRDLYQHETIFRQEMDRCLEILKPLIDYDIKEILYPGDSVSEVSGEISPKSSEPQTSHTSHTSHAQGNDKINQTEIAQLVIFIFEYALARLLMKWGIKPDSMIGYSLGEYTAACISGVFSLEDALKIMVIRGELIKCLPRGGMLSVPLAKDQLEPLMKEFVPALSIAIDNGPSCIVSGLENTVDAFAGEMKKKKLFCLRLNASHGIHSREMAPIVKEYNQALAELDLNAPQIPYISNVTGTWIKPEEALAPTYWTTHLTNTVRFADGIDQLLQQPNNIFIEVGPGRDLCSLLANQSDSKLHQQTINLVRPQQSDLSDLYYLLSKVGQLWLRGTNIHWHAFYHGEPRHRLSLPTYPFERQFFPVRFETPGIQRTEPAKDALVVKKRDIADWFYYPSWMRSQLSLNNPGSSTDPGRWLVFALENEFCSLLIERLKQEGHKVIIVTMGKEFKPVKEDAYTLDPRQKSDYPRLLEVLAREEIPPRVVHTWSMASQETGLKAETIENALITGFYSMIYLAKALGKQDIPREIQLQVITCQLQEVTGQEAILPQQAPVLGPLKVIPQEYPFIRCTNVDILLPQPGSPMETKLVEQMLVELTGETLDTDIAYRNQYRWVKTFRPIRFGEVEEQTSRLRGGGVYLITGGLGKIGLTLAEYLVESMKARLILVGRSKLPERDQWEQILVSAGNGDITALKIRKLKQMEARGGQVLTFFTDVTDQAGMEAVISQAEQRFGPINGVIHAAGDTRNAIVRSIEHLTPNDCQQQFMPKIHGLLTLEKVLRGKKLDFYWLTSSLSPTLGGLGFSAYSAANHFMDAFVKWIQHQNPGNPAYWISVNWADWKFEPGKEKSPAGGDRKEQGGMEGDGWLMTPHEGIETFRRILSHSGAHQVVVSTVDLQGRLDRWVTMKSIREPREDRSQKTTALYYRSRPQLETNYVKPTNPIENAIAEVLQDFLGIEEVGTHDNFFELGATSLNIIQINSIARKKLHQEISVMWWFEHPTIKTLSGHLLEQTRENTGGEAAVKVKETGEKRGQAVKKGKTRLGKLKKRVNR